MQGVHIVDSRGQDVGAYINGVVLRHVNGLDMVVDGVAPSGFVSFGYFPYVYPTPDCSGPRYLDADPRLFMTQAYSTGTQILYPSNPQPLFIRSGKTVMTTNPDDPARCRTGDELITGVQTVGLLATIDTASLNLTPPFHIQY
jgi:hypothetical protein